jgi:hypothetical protein
MQPRKRQVFLEFDDTFCELVVFRLQRSNAHQQRFNSLFVGAIHRSVESKPYRRVNLPIPRYQPAS